MRLLAITALMFCCVNAANAAERPAIASETFTLTAGAFLSDFDTSVELRGPNGNGGKVNLEDVLDLDSDQSTFKADAAWRFLPRHRVSLGYYEFNRDARAVAQNSFVLETPSGDFEFDGGATIGSEFNWRLIPLTYSYSFLQREKWEVAAVAGVHWFNAKFGIDGEATVNGVPVASAATAESASAPLPVLGINSQYAITPKWRVGAHLNWFGLDYDDISGQLTDVRVFTEYAVFKSLSVGLGYTWYDINIKEDNDSYKFEVDYSYDGLEAMVNYRF